MGKKSRAKSRQTVVPEGAVGPRQPCPCGSGARYKACHGKADGAAPRYVARPFAGLRSECDIVAMRELVPAATAEVRLQDAGERGVVLCTLLPMAAPALVRDDGTIWLGLQVQHGFGDPSRDAAAVLEKALSADPGGMVGLTAAPGAGPRLQDLLADAPLMVEVHKGFDYWVADLDDPDGALASSIEAANGSASPTVRLSSVEAGYWTQIGAKEHLRWVLPQDEDGLLTALARLHVSGGDALMAGSRLVGMFRAHGLLAPVWDLPLGTGAEALEEPAAIVLARLEEALADASPLSSEARSARQGLATRQVTIR